MTYSRFVHHSMAAALGVVLSTAVPPHATAQEFEHQVVSIIGLTEVSGHPALVDIMLDLPPGADLAAEAREALRRVNARPTTEHDFALLDLQWPQFFDRDKDNDFVLQYENPEGDPTGGAASSALVNAQRTWSEVTRSRFALSYAGTTTAGAAFDGLNTVSWLSPWPLLPNYLGLAISVFDVDTGNIIDADVVLNADRSGWSADAAGPPPGGIDVESVVLHENGHVAGIAHSSDPTAVMAPDYFLGTIKRGLADDDVDAVSTLYPLRALATLPPPQGPPPGLGVVAGIGDAAPGGGVYGAFEPYAFADRGVPAFVADFFHQERGTAGQGAYSAGGPGALLARSGGTAPGGGRFGSGVLFGMGSNETGGAAFSFQLDLPGLPFGVNAGVYRYSGPHDLLKAVVVPGLTPAPTGGVFEGAYEHTSINANGDVAFAGIVPTTAGISGDLGIGVFLERASGALGTLVAPGDAAPGGGTFDLADMPSINVRGELAFGAHVRGELCVTNRPQELSIHCDEGLYLRRASGEITAIVRRGDPAPGGGTFASVRFPAINDGGQIVFVGDLTPAPGRNRDLGVYLYSAGVIMPIAIPGQAMPDGGNLRQAFVQSSINALGEVAFGARLDTGSESGPDSGVYVWSSGSLRLVARSGMPMAGEDFLVGITFPSVAINSAGRVLFSGDIGRKLVPPPPGPPPPGEPPPPPAEGEAPPPPPPGEPPPPALIRLPTLFLADGR